VSRLIFFFTPQTFKEWFAAIEAVA
jgi:hypothetical protein